MDERVKLETTVSYRLAEDEKKRLYIALALAQYRYNRVPEYKENQLLSRLCSEFKRFNGELIRLHELDPNNLILNQLSNFISMHYGELKRLAPSQEPELSEQNL